MVEVYVGIMEILVHHLFSDCVVDDRFVFRPANGLQDRRFPGIGSADDEDPEPGDLLLIFEGTHRIGWGDVV